MNSSEEIVRFNSAIAVAYLNIRVDLVSRPREGRPAQRGQETPSEEGPEGRAGPPFTQQSICLREEPSSFMRV